MPAWWPALCLFVFTTHLPFFAWRYARTHERRYAATTLTFALLCVVYALRIFAPDAAIAGTPWWEIARVPAWLSAAVSIGLLVRHHAVELRARAR